MQPAILFFKKIHIPVKVVKELIFKEVIINKVPLSAGIMI
jgi:hypothetical protein